MPTLDWIGKQAVVNHHRELPTRLLHCNGELSFGDPEAGNLLVEGDNLEALKALLPYYAGKVKCIYIDPPYNTGNEGWVYNDNVNSPEIKSWLGSTVGKEAEDLTRHEKWLCMMYPRLRLLREFLTDDGLILVSLDDTELPHARLMMDEIFSRKNFLANIAWEKRFTRSNNANLFYSLKDAILVYRKSDALNFLREARTEKSDSNYRNPDNDHRGPWTTSSYVNPATREQRRNLVYEIIRPNGDPVEHPTHAWKYEREEHERHIRENRLWWGEDGTAKYPRAKIFLSENIEGIVPVDLWSFRESGTTDDAGAEIRGIFGRLAFETPKPTQLIRRIIRLTCDRESIIMDSFAGSGSTAHSVLLENDFDSGNRKFILIEMDKSICSQITSERVRRVIGGYQRDTSEKVELFSRKITRQILKNGQKLLDELDSIVADKESEYEKVWTEIEDGVARVYAQRHVREPIKGLGGGFRYCELGKPLFDEWGAVTEGVTFSDLAAFVYFSDTGSPIPRRAEHSSPLIGTFQERAIYLLFTAASAGLPDPRSGNTLTIDVLKSLPKPDPNFSGPRIVYGEGCTVPAERLAADGVIFKQVPYQLVGA